ncbi:3-deoxy-manno-octulosonate cytidylyltransferase [Aeromonas bivalvium]|uniref:3-deoxy-manno-octulosonate cytidylyltransferase n=1 Tax=Aeromonas bivalvium TaxID=440079 RepID=UPI0038CFCB6A
MSFVVVIPARYASTRLPGKPLADIAGRPMVQHVVEKALQSGADRVIVATDDDRVRAALAPFVATSGAEVCMTSPDHQSGTERLAEVCRHYGFTSDTIIVNVQGDEPLIPPAIIRQVADNLAAASAPMATLSVPILDAEEAFNPNAVKVVTDKDGYALYFSRAPIPWERDSFAVSREQIGPWFQRHIGIYAYRAGFIERYVTWAPSQLEQVECLEQLRVLWYGEKIHVAQALAAPPVGVDTQADLDKVRALLARP